MSFYKDVAWLSFKELDSYRLTVAPAALNTLSGLRKEIVSHYRKSRDCISLIGSEKATRDFISVEESSFESRFFCGQLHPCVDGYEWYRGWFIPYEGESGIIIFEPWLATEFDMAKEHLVLVGGSVPEEWISKVIYFIVLAARDRIGGISTNN